ncbi:MAG: hypothetical protein BGO03_16795 [Mesorhizobium sp. 61-13]|nr:MAG: hypothetical protein BGO03_16795 [Mesorhizobium sp. 61-13]
MDGSNFSFSYGGKWRERPVAGVFNDVPRGKFELVQEYVGYSANIAMRALVSRKVICYTPHAGRVRPYHVRSWRNW